MREFTVTVTHKITLEEISSLLCSAFEGGSNSWCRIDQFIDPTTWEFDSEPLDEDRESHYAQDYPLNPAGAVLLYDVEEDEGKTMRLDMDSIQKGIEVLARNYPHCLIDIINENADANTGDIFLQCCLFGEVIYA